MSDRKVELVQLSGTNLATGRKQYYEIWTIHVTDGEDRYLAGRLDWHDDAKIIYLTQVDPFLRKWIDEEVSKQVERELDSCEFRDLTSVVDELERDSINEFDEKDLTG
jgi:hypothetical protein